MHSVQCFLFMLCAVFQSVQTGNNQRFHSRYKKDPFTEQLVFYPWTTPIYQSPYSPNFRDISSGVLSTEDRTRHFWANLFNNFRNGWGNSVNAQSNGIRLANNLLAVLGEEGIKQLAYYVATTISPGSPGPPGPQGPKGEKGDSYKLSPTNLPGINQNQQILLKGEKGEKGSCGCNEETTTSGTTTTDTRPTDEPTTTEETTEWPTTTELTTRDGSLTTDVDSTTTEGSFLTNQPTEGTTTPGGLETTENTVTTEDSGPTGEHTTMDGSPTVEPTTEGFIPTESSTISTEEPSTTTDGFSPVTTDEPSITTENLNPTTEGTGTTVGSTTEESSTNTDGTSSTTVFTTTEETTEEPNTTESSTTSEKPEATTPEWPESTTDFTSSENPGTTTVITTTSERPELTTEDFSTTVGSTTTEEPSITTEDAGTTIKTTTPTPITTTTERPESTTEGLSTTESSTTTEEPSVTTEDAETTVRTTTPEGSGSTTEWSSTITDEASSTTVFTTTEDPGTTTLILTTSEENGSSEGASTTTIYTEEPSSTTEQGTTVTLSTTVASTIPENPETTEPSTTTPPIFTTPEVPNSTTEVTKTTTEEISNTTEGSSTGSTTTVSSTTTEYTTTEGFNTTTEGSTSTTQEINPTSEGSSTPTGSTTTEDPTTTSSTTQQPDTTTTGMTTTNSPDSLIVGCDQNIDYKNATWQSPPNGTPYTSKSCQLRVEIKDDNTDLKNREPICQIRLDFHQFSIAQPNRQSRCATDQFQVVNVGNIVPVICGDNQGQHMYLTPISSESEVDLIFTFGQLESSTRLWEIKVTLIPCCANHLIAPNDCLQYFNEFGGIVKSFNWMEGTPAKPRQLANQEYNICFKSDSLVSSICYKPCPVKTGLAFSVSQNSRRGPYRAGAGVDDCTNDFLLIANGYNRFDPSKRNDRFCGNIFNSNGNVTANQPALTGTASTTVCSQVKPFQIYYTTNRDELADVSNNGFCLQYQQEYSTKNRLSFRG